jgi:uncharacterized protein YoxC
MLKIELEEKLDKLSLTIRNYRNQIEDLKKENELLYKKLELLKYINNSKEMLNEY